MTIKIEVGANPKWARNKREGERKRKRIKRKQKQVRRQNEKRRGRRERGGGGGGGEEEERWRVVEQVNVEKENEKESLGKGGWKTRGKKRRRERDREQRGNVNSAATSPAAHTPPRVVLSATCNHPSVRIYTMHAFNLTSTRLREDFFGSTTRVGSVRRALLLARERKGKNRETKRERESPARVKYRLEGWQKGSRSVIPVFLGLALRLRDEENKLEKERVIYIYIYI